MPSYFVSLLHSGTALMHREFYSLFELLTYTEMKHEIAQVYDAKVSLAKAALQIDEDNPELNIAYLNAKVSHASALLELNKCFDMCTAKLLQSLQTQYLPRSAENSVFLTGKGLFEAYLKQKSTNDQRDKDAFKDSFRMFARLVCEYDRVSTIDREIMDKFVTLFNISFYTKSRFNSSKSRN